MRKLKFTFLIGAFFIAYGGATHAQDVPNGNMELWVPSINVPPTEEPDGWITSNTISKDTEPPYMSPNNVQRITESASGLFAAKLNTVELNGEPVSAFMITFRNIQSLVFDRPGFAINQQVLKLDGKYKYTPEKEDFAFVYMIISKYIDGRSKMVGFGWKLLGKTSAEYQDFEVPVTYIHNPPMQGDSALIYITNTTGGANPPIGSTLYIDDLSLFTNTGISATVFGSTETLSTYPNPANEYIEFTYNLEQAGAVHLKVMDVTGRIVYEQQGQEQFPGAYTLKLATGSYPTGLYSLVLTCNNRSVASKFVIAR